MAKVIGETHYSKFSPKERVPVAGPAPAGLVLDHLDLPERLRGHGRGGGGPGCQPQEHWLLLPILVHCEELLLLGVEQSDHVPAFEDILLVLLVLKEQVYLPACLRVDNIDLKVSRIKIVLENWESLTSLQPGLSSSSWLAATCNTWNDAKLIYHYLIILLSHDMSLLLGEIVRCPWAVNWLLNVCHHGQ